MVDTKSTSPGDVPGSWDWPEDLPDETQQFPRSSRTEPSHTEPLASDEDSKKQKKYWGPRNCRICLETVLPTFHTPSQNLPGILQGKPYVTYESEGGRLLRPCRCKGSSRYVHDSCLQEWRHADPAYGKRNYWQCPTCHFQYRLERLNWGRWVSSKAAQLALTLMIFFLSVFLLGFLADPIIDLYLDPLGTIVYGTSDEYYDEDADWISHFIKGFASLGLLGFVKVFLTLSPFHWYSLRSTGIMGSSGRPGTTGRDRAASINWLFVVLGVVTFLYTVWKGVRAWSRRVLEKAGERVIDVQGDDEGDDLDESSSN